MAKKKSPPKNPSPAVTEVNLDAHDAPGESSVPPDQRLVIVGIGASAGGQEAFEKFFAHLPDESNLAFVVVQHLDPTHKSILTELLQRYTRLKVLQAQDGLHVEPNCVYVIPPNRTLAIFHGALHLLERQASRGLHLPIDSFFRSLAQDQGDKAVGIILSGTGSDGTLGLTAIKGEGGLTMVQDPASAGYDGMPRSALATGLVDYVLPPEQLPGQLLAYLKQPYIQIPAAIPSLAAPAADWLHKIYILLASQTGHDFSLYKQKTVARRIERRMALQQIERIEEYYRYLQQTPAEVGSLFKELLIGVTSFFRDPAAFATLEQEVIPRLFEQREPGGSLRVWIPGCATGEEAYSLAILLREFMDTLKGEFKVQLFATDINAGVIEQVRLGRYSLSIAADVSPDSLAPREAEVQSRDGGWYLMRICPYRTVNNIIEGVMLTFNDITEQKEAQIQLGQLQATVQVARDLAENIVNMVRDPLLVLAGDLQVVSANLAFYEVFQTTPEETMGQLIYELSQGQWDKPRLSELLEEIIPQRTSLENFELEFNFPALGPKRLHFHARQIEPAGGTPL